MRSINKSEANTVMDVSLGNVIEEEGSPPILGSDGTGPHANKGRHGGGRGGGGEGRGGGGDGRRDDRSHHHDRRRDDDKRRDGYDRNGRDDRDHSRGPPPRHQDNRGGRF